MLRVFGSCLNTCLRRKAGLQQLQARTATTSTRTSRDSKCRKQLCRLLQKTRVFCINRDVVASRSPSTPCSTSLGCHQQAYLAIPQTINKPLRPRPDPQLPCFHASESLYASICAFVGRIRPCALASGASNRNHAPKKISAALAPCPNRSKNKDAYFLQEGCARHWTRNPLPSLQVCSSTRTGQPSRNRGGSYAHAGASPAISPSTSPASGASASPGSGGGGTTVSSSDVASSEDVPRHTAFFQREAADHVAGGRQLQLGGQP